MSIPTGQSPARRDQSAAHECEEGSPAGRPEDDQLELVGAAERSDVLALHRLEASIRWLQREAASRRLPRAATLPPVRGLAAPSAARSDAEPGDVIDACAPGDAKAPVNAAVRRTSP
jgi:hypothetical protein